MKVDIKRTGGLRMKNLLAEISDPHLSDGDMAIMDQCMLLSETLWIGMVDKKFACVWGIIPPTLMSTRAYLWLYTTELIKEHQFVFVRHSQRAIELILQDYECIIGHCLVDAEHSKRWLKWLGAEFGHPDGRKIPFVIRKK